MECRCRKTEEPVPKWPLKLESPGCSGMGGMAVFSGGQADKEDPLRSCCDQQHACVQTCGISKAFCDDAFKKCNEEVCKAMVDEEQRKQCETSKQMNEIMASIAQCGPYDREQNNHCECVPKEDAPSKRERVLRAFYKKFNPDSVDKVPGLVKKADTPKKMAGLLIKLYKKYPQVIRSVKDPQQEMMEQAMKGNKEKEAENNDAEAESDTEDLGTEEL